MQQSHSRHQKTTSQLFRITLKGRLRGQQWKITGVSYVHKPMVNCLGAPTIYYFANISKILIVSDKTIIKTFIIHKTLYKQYPFEKFWIFTVYQNYFSFKPWWGWKVTGQWTSKWRAKLLVIHIIGCPGRRMWTHAASRKTDNVHALLVPGRRAWMIKLPQFKNPISIVNKLAWYDIWRQNLAWYEILTNKTYKW